MDRELRPAGGGLWESYCGVWNLAISNWESQYFQGENLLVFIRLTSVAVKDGTEEQDQRPWGPSGQFQ